MGHLLYPFWGWRETSLNAGNTEPGVEGLNNNPTVMKLLLLLLLYLFLSFCNDVFGNNVCKCVFCREFKQMDTWAIFISSDVSTMFNPNRL